MAVTTPWRIGSAAFGFIDLPGFTDAPVDFAEQGGSARSVNGTLLFDRTGPVKRQLALTSDQAVESPVWTPLLQLYRTSPGPWDFYDPTLPNLLTNDDRLMDGWVTAAGAAIAAPRSMRVRLDGTTTSAQTAVTTAPPILTLIPVIPGSVHTAAITVSSSAGFAGTLAVYGYTGPTGSGTLLGAATSLTADGRYLVTFTPGAGVSFAAIRLARTAGLADVGDPSVFYGPLDPGAALYQVQLSGVKQTPYPLGDRSGWSLTVTEI